MKNYLNLTWAGVLGVYSLLTGKGDDDDNTTPFWMIIAAFLIALVIFFVFRKSFMRMFRKVTPKAKTRIKKVYVNSRSRFRRRR